MRILFLTDNFPPEVNAPATRTHEHCKEWVKKGAEVTVITCFPNFPKGKVYEGYKNQWKKTEEIDGYLSNLATLNAGIAWDAEMFYLDLTGGVGYLYNSTFTGFLYMGDLALRFKLPTEVMTLGPHVSLLEFQPDWDGDADVSLADTTGYVAGLAFTVGTKPFSFAASIDYVDAAIEVESDRLPVANEDLDMSGLAVQVGVLFRF